MLLCRGFVSIETIEHCHNADLDHYMHLPADQRCSPQFHWSLDDIKRASHPVNLLQSDRQCLLSLQPFCPDAVCVWIIHKHVSKIESDSPSQGCHVSLCDFLPTTDN